MLGPTGRNFAAGMSGGIAYVWAPGGGFESNCNLEMVELERVEIREEMSELKGLIQNHFQYTASTVAEEVLSDWDSALPQFVKVMPMDYKRILQEGQRSGKQSGLASMM